MIVFFLKKILLESFLVDLSKCFGIISNAGFNVISDALFLGKRLLVKPLKLQFEQIINASHLKKMKKGMVVKELTEQKIRKWLDGNNLIPCEFPEYTKYFVNWIVSRDYSNSSEMIKNIWNRTLN